MRNRKKGWITGSVAAVMAVIGIVCVFSKKEERKEEKRMALNRESTGFCC